MSEGSDGGNQRRRRRRQSSLENKSQGSKNPDVMPEADTPVLEAVIQSSEDAETGTEAVSDAVPEQPLIFSGDLEWTIVRRGRSYRLRLIQTEDTFKGHYVGISNPSTFEGTITCDRDLILIAFTQFTPTNAYQVSHDGTLVEHNLIMGDWEDTVGNGGEFELRASVMPASVSQDPDSSVSDRPTAPPPSNLPPGIAEMLDIGCEYPELLKPPTPVEDEADWEDDDYDESDDQPLPIVSTAIAAEWQWVLTAESLQNADLQGAQLAGVDLSGKDLTGANLTRADLRYSQLQAANLAGASLVRANLSYANLRNTNFQGANLARSHLARASLIRTNLKAANLMQAKLIQTKIETYLLSDANFCEATLMQASLNTLGLGTIPQRVNFTSACFDQVNAPYYLALENCDCRWATFRQVNFGISRKDDVDDRTISLTQCNLQHTDWTAADLNGIRVDGSSFRHACFEWANLDDVDFGTADCHGVDFRQVAQMPRLNEQT